MDKMNNAPLISVIIPIYNAQNYLSDCIKSVLSQTFTSFELILVDDGSIDNSFEICKFYMNKDKRVFDWRQKNSGVSAARNHGLKLAHGEFICFVDSNDMLTDNALQSLFDALKKREDCDLVCGSFRRIYCDKSFADNCLPSYEVNSNTDLISLCCQMQLPIILGSCWAKLYRKSIIDSHKIDFPIGMKYYEDNAFNLPYYQSIRTAILLNSVIYIYRENKESASYNINPKNLEDYINVAKLRYQFFKALNIFDFSTFATKIAIDLCYMFGKLAKQNNKEIIKTAISDDFIYKCIKASQCSSNLTFKQKSYLFLIKTKSPCVIFSILILLQKIRNIYNHLF